MQRRSFFGILAGLAALPFGAALARSFGFRSVVSPLCLPESAVGLSEPGSIWETTSSDEKTSLRVLDRDGQTLGLYDDLELYDGKDWAPKPRKTRAELESLLEEIRRV